MDITLKLDQAARELLATVLESAAAGELGYKEEADLVATATALRQDEPLDRPQAQLLLARVGGHDNALDPSYDSPLLAACKRATLQLRDHLVIGDQYIEVDVLYPSGYPVLSRLVVTEAMAEVFGITDGTYWDHFVTPLGGGAWGVRITPALLGEVLVNGSWGVRTTSGFLVCTTEADDQE